MVILSLAMVITIRFFYFWQIMKLNELKLMGIVFSFAYLGILANVASILTNALFWFQLAVFSFNAVGLTLIHFYLNLHYNRLERVIKIFSWVWFGLLTILLLFWTPFIQPEYANVLFIFNNLPHTRGDAHPYGAGLKVPYKGKETIIYSTSHQLLGILFWFFSVSLSLYQLYRMEVPEKQAPSIQKRINNARRNFLIERGLHLIWVVSLFPIYPVAFIPLLSSLNALVLISYSLIAYTVLKYPEAMVMSKDQFKQTFEKISEVFLRRSFTNENDTYLMTLVSIIENYNLDDLKGRGVVITDLEEPYGFYISKSSLIRYQKTFHNIFNSLLISNFIAAFSSFSDEIFDQSAHSPRIQRIRNGEYEVYVLIINQLMFAYVFKGVSLLLKTKVENIARSLLADETIKNYLLSENAKQDLQIVSTIDEMVKETFNTSELVL